MVTMADEEPGGASDGRPVLLGEWTVVAHVPSPMKDGVAEEVITGIETALAEMAAALERVLAPKHGPGTEIRITS